MISKDKGWELELTQKFLQGNEQQEPLVDGYFLSLVNIYGRILLHRDGTIEGTTLEWTSQCNAFFAWIDNTVRYCCGPTMQETLPPFHDQDVSTIAAEKSVATPSGDGTSLANDTNTCPTISSNTEEHTKKFGIALIQEVGAMLCQRLVFASPTQKVVESICSWCTLFPRWELFPVFTRLGLLLARNDNILRVLESVLVSYADQVDTDEATQPTNRKIIRSLVSAMTQAPFHPLFGMVLEIVYDRCFNEAPQLPASLDDPLLEEREFIAQVLSAMMRHQPAAKILTRHVESKLGRRVSNENDNNLVVLLLHCLHQLRKQKGSVGEQAQAIWNNGLNRATLPERVKVMVENVGS